MLLNNELAELLDQECQFRTRRQLHAKLNPNDDNSKRLSNFCWNKCQLLQEEIDALDDVNKGG